jgi:hypothetical protein
MHIYDPRYSAAPSWPLVLPNAPLAAYRGVQAELGLSRAVIVSPTATFRQRLHRSGARTRSSARGIAIRPDTAAVDIERL